MRDAAGMGFALRLAGDVGKAWAEEGLARAQATEAARRLAEANEAELQQLYRETLADPDATAQDKALAREFLKTAAAGGAL